MKRLSILIIILSFASSLDAQKFSDYTEMYRKDFHGDSIVNGVQIRTEDLQLRTLSDSVELLMKSLALTNIELRRTNSRIRTYATMTYTAIACEGLGALCFYIWGQQPTIAYNSYGEPYVPARDDSLKDVGTAFCIVGGVIYLASYIPLFGRYLTVDERGLVVRAKLFGKYPKR